MKRSKITSLKSSQQIVSSTITTNVVSASSLPDDCWKHIFKFLPIDENIGYLEPLSLVSKELLSVTNRLLFSLTIRDPTLPFLPRLLQRFTSLTSLDLSCYEGDLDVLLHQISYFPMNITSLDISSHPTIPARGLRAFSQNITTLTSLVCSNIDSLEDLLLISDCFPFLEELDLNNSNPCFNRDFHIMNFVVDVMSMALPKLRKVTLISMVITI